MSFAVGFTPRARSDISGIVSWIGQRNPSTSARWRDRFLSDVSAKLESDPNRYPTAVEAVKLGIDLRELHYGRRPHVYRVFFTIKSRSVVVHRVRHAAQDHLDAEDF